MSVVPERVSSEPRWFIHYLARVHVSSATTGGAFSLLEMSAKTFDSPLHVHHHEVPRGARDLRDGRIREHDHSADDHRSRRDHFDEVEGFSAHGLVQ